MLLYRLHGTAPRHTLLLQALSGAFIITALEMVVGVLDNLVLQWHVWSYREMPWNVYGQICLPFSVLWFLVCIPALGICEVVRKRFQWPWKPEWYENIVAQNFADDKGFGCKFNDFSRKFITLEIRWLDYKWNIENKIKILSKLNRNFPDEMHFLPLEKNKFPVSIEQQKRGTCMKFVKCF